MVEVQRCRQHYIFLAYASDTNNIFLRNFYDMNSSLFNKCRHAVFSRNIGSMINTEQKFIIRNVFFFEFFS